MRIWSRGLGRVELAIDLKKATIVADKDHLYITGKTEPPAAWDFVINVDPSELWRLARTVVNRRASGFIRSYLCMRVLNGQDMKARYQLATSTRTGVKPDQEYAGILKKKPSVVAVASPG